MEGIGLPEKAKIDKKSLEKRTAGDKNRQNTKMEASDGRTRELRSSVGGRRPKWEKPVAGGSLTCPHAPPTRLRMVAVAERETHACGRGCYLLSMIFPPVGRSGRGNSKGGVISWK